MDFNVNLADFQKSMKQTEKEFTTEFRKSILKTTDRLQKKIEQNTPVITGVLKKSNKTKEKLKKEKIEISITNDAFYAGYVEDGTSRFSGRKFYQRSLDSMEDEFIKDLLKNL